MLQEKSFKFCQCIFTILLLAPLKKGVAFVSNKLDFLSPEDAMYQILLKLAQYGV